jgi:hypothetical protein
MMIGAAAKIAYSAVSQSSPDVNKRRAQAQKYLISSKRESYAASKLTGMAVAIALRLHGRSYLPV